MAIAWPEIVEGAWVKIATAVTTGTIDRLKSEFTYWITTVATGATAPLDAVKLKSPKIFENSNQEEIGNSTAIDVYIWIENSDTSVDSTSTNCIQVDAI